LPTTITLLPTGVSAFAIVAGFTLAVVILLNVRHVTVPSVIPLTTLLSTCSSGSPAWAASWCSYSPTAGS
jgi:hypothetical protein